MNTPRHAILNLALLTQKTHLSHPFPILVGAILPDVPIFILYGWAKLIQRLPESVIWTETYYQPFWQNLTALGHSIPLTSLGFILSALGGWETPPSSLPAWCSTVWGICLSTMMTPIDIFSRSVSIALSAPFPIGIRDTTARLFP